MSIVLNLNKEQTDLILMSIKLLLDNYEQIKEDEAVKDVYRILKEVKELLESEIIINMHNKNKKL